MSLTNATESGADLRLDLLAEHAGKVVTRREALEPVNVIEILPKGTDFARGVCKTKGRGAVMRRPPKGRLPARALSYACANSDRSSVTYRL